MSDNARTCKFYSPVLINVIFHTLGNMGDVSTPRSFRRDVMFSGQIISFLNIRSDIVNRTPRRTAVCLRNRKLGTLKLVKKVEILLNVILNFVTYHLPIIYTWRAVARTFCFLRETINSGNSANICGILIILKELKKSYLEAIMMRYYSCILSTSLSYQSTNVRLSGHAAR